MGKPFRKTAELLLLHLGFAKSHVETAFNLAAPQSGIQRAPNVVSNPSRRDCEPSCRWIHLHLNHRGRIGIGWRWAYAAAFIQSGRFRRGVRTNRSQRSKFSFCQANGILKRNAPVGRVLVENLMISEA